jgi:hypothetical protein
MPLARVLPLVLFLLPLFVASQPNFQSEFKGVPTAAEATTGDIDPSMPGVTVRRVALACIRDVLMNGFRCR